MITPSIVGHMTNGNTTFPSCKDEPTLTSEE